MATRKIFVFLISFLGVSSQAQIGAWVKEQYAIPPTLSLGLEGRNSFLNGSPTKVTGIKMVFNFGEMYRAGLGYFDNSIFRKPDAKFSFLGIFNDFQLLKNKKLEANISLMMDFGELKPSVNQEAKATVAYETLLGGQLAFLRYFYAGAAVGYRVGIINPYAKQFSLSAPLYQLKLGLNFSAIVKELRK